MTDLGYRLSRQQARLWRVGSRRERSVVTLDLHPGLGERSLKSALRALAARHSALRARFVEVAGASTPLMAPAPEADVELATLELPAHEPSLFGFAVEHMRRERSRRETAPDVRATLVRGREALRACLVLSLPALSADSLSLRFVAEQLSALLADDDLGPRALAYEAYAAWQSSELQGDAGDPVAAWNWREHARAPARDEAGVVHVLPFEASAGKLCVELATRFQVEVPALLLAALRTAVAASLVPRPGIIGVLCHGRREEELERAIGLFAHYVPIRARAHGRAFGELMADSARLLEHLDQKQDRLIWPDGSADLGLPWAFEVHEAAPPRGASALRVLEHLAHVDRAGPTLRAHLDAGLPRLDVVAPAAELDAARVLYARVLEALESARRDGPARAQVPAPASRPERSLVARFLETARRQPESAAVAAHGEVVTYAALAAAVATKLSVLRRRRIQPEERVAVCIQPGTELLAWVLGILAHGAAFVLIEPGDPPRRKVALAQAAAARLLVTERSLAPIGFSGDVHLVDEPPEPTDDAEPRAPRDPAALAPNPGNRSIDGLAYVCFTSGSTGEPKGVMVSERSLIGYLSWAIEAYAIAPGCTVPLHTALSADLTLTSLFAPLMVGGVVEILQSPDAELPLARELQRGASYDLVKLTPTHLRLLTDAARERPLIGSIEVLVVGGETLTTDDVARWERLMPCRVVNEYGPTEATVGCVAYELRPASEPTLGSVPIGEPVAGARVQLLGRGLEQVPTGATGELYLSGPGLARGYIGRPDLTAERFVPNPHGEPGERMYRTGDLGRLGSDAELHFLGRADDQVKILGHRVEPAEVEAVLVEHPLLRAAAVVPRAHRGAGQRLAAFVVPVDPTQAPGEHALRAHVAGRLPAAMVPTWFFSLDRLPLTRSGKVDRRALAELGSTAPQKLSTEGLDDLERVLLSLFADVLGRYDITRDDSFFRVGGDSVLGLTLVARARALGVTITPRQLFAEQSVARLAAVASRGAQDETEPETAARLSATVAQRRLLGARGFLPEEFVQVACLRTSARPDLDALNTALARLFRRHAALRGRLERRDGEWVQEDGVAPMPALIVKESGDLAHESRALRRAIDVYRGPLARAVLLECASEGCWRLLLGVHHLAVDVVSWGIVLSELEQFYVQALEGSVGPEPAAGSLRKYLERIARSAPADEIEFWRQQLDEPEMRNDAEAHEEAIVRCTNTEREVLEEHHLTRLIGRLEASAGPAGLETVVLTAALLGLARATKRRAFAVEMERHGRAGDDVDLALVGWLGVAFPLRFEVDPNDTYAAAFRAVAERLGAVPGDGSGYGRLRYVQGEPALTAAPPPPIGFNFLGRAYGKGRPSALGVLEEVPSPTLSKFNALTVEVAVLDGALDMRWSHDAEFEPEVVRAAAREAVRVLRSCKPELEDEYPLSPNQAGILFHSIWSEGSGAYVACLSCRCHGPLDPETLKAAYEAVTARHDVLRTEFRLAGARDSSQLVRRQVAVDFEVLEPFTGPGAASELVARERRRGFDAERAPLHRMRVARLGPEEWTIVLCFHHAIVDGWSLGIFFSELFASHRALSGEAEAPLGPVRQYRDFVVMTRRLRGDEGFWRELLGPALRRGGARRAEARGRAARPGMTRVRALDAAASEALKRFAAEHALTLSAVLASAWLVALQRGSAELGPTFGIAFAGRPLELQREPMLGLCINTLPVPRELDVEANVLELLRSNQRLLLELKERETTSLADVKRCCGLGPAEDLFASVLVVENYPRPTLSFPTSLAIDDVVFTDSSHYPLTITACAGESVWFQAAYDDLVCRGDDAEKLVDGLARAASRVHRYAERTVREWMAAPTPATPARLGEDT